MNANELPVEMWPIERVIPYFRNARKMPEAAIEKVAASLRTFGWRQPIVVDREGVIIVGHTRLAAAKRLGMTQVPVHVAENLTPEQVRAYRLADNRTHEETAWDLTLLAVELSDLASMSVDLTSTAFDEIELDRLLPSEDDERANAAPPLPLAPVTRPGDIWLLGQHRLLCGDATQIVDVQKVLAGGLADMVFTDPPYNVDYEGKTSRKLKIDNDTLGGRFYEFLRDASANMLAMATGAIYICMSSSELHTLHRAFTDAGGHWSTFVIWAKHHFTLGRSDYQRMYEPILYGWREGAQHFWCGERDQGDVWSIKRPMANLEHPTMKPVELVERAILNSSKPRGTILDPFGGSGTTVIACQKTGRQARVIELDPRYCDVIVRRWQDFTGLKAQLDGDGRGFEEIAAERLGQVENAAEEAVPAA